MHKERNTRRNTRRRVGFTTSGHFPPNAPKAVSSPSATIAVTNTCPIMPPFSPCCLFSTTLSPFAAALPGPPPYECITKRTSFQISMSGCSDSLRIDAASLAPAAVSAFSQFKESSARQWVSNFEVSRMLKTLGLHKRSCHTASCKDVEVQLQQITLVSIHGLWHH